MARIQLTDKYITSPQRVPTAGRKEWHDALVPGLSLIVSATGHRSFALVKRYPLRPKNPTRRSLGTYGQITLEEARTKARAWLAMIDRGIDPAVERARERADNQRKMSTSFAKVADDFLTKFADKHLVKKVDCRRMIGNDYVKRFGALPVTEISAQHIATAVQAVATRSEAQAHISFSYVRRLFSWAINQHAYGITTSPCDKIKPTELIAPRVVRSRYLTDNELRQVWQAADKTGFPVGAFVKLLILTGQRLREVSNATWSEFDLEAKLWTIPKERMKSKREHVIPLAPMALELLNSLPRFKRGNFVFTTTSGAKAFNGFQKAKERIDALSGVGGNGKDHWTYHDLRRTFRTKLSSLPIEDRLREAMIAHSQPGLHQVYNLYNYLPEKKRGFVLFEQLLATILSPKPPATIADLGAARRKKLPAA